VIKMPTPLEMLNAPTGLSSLSRYGNTSVVPPAPRPQPRPALPAVPMTEPRKPAPGTEPARPAPQGTLAEVQPRPERVVTAAEVPVIIPPEIPGLPPEAQRVVREAVNAQRKAQAIAKAMALADVLRGILGMKDADIRVTDNLDDVQLTRNAGVDHGR
jgi:hypothetical protein